MGYKKYTTNVYFYDNVEPYKSNKTAHKSCTNEIQLSYVSARVTQQIISNRTINYFLLFQTYMSMLKFFFGVENMCHIQLRKKNLGNLCQKSISKCNAIYSWKKRLLWCKFNIFQYVQFPTYYIKHNWLSRVDVKLVIRY